MSVLIVVTADFRFQWPLAPDFLKTALENRGYADVELRNLKNSNEDALQNIELGEISLLIGLGWQPLENEWRLLTDLREVAFPPMYGSTVLSEASKFWVESHSILLREQEIGAFWGQSVAECGIALTLAALRRIPQRHIAMMQSLDVWDRTKPETDEGSGVVGEQFSDDFPFTSGTLAGKRVRIAGMGNIGARYAHLAQAFGAEIAAYDPFVADSIFRIAGARRIWNLNELLVDAEIFVMMIPESPTTRNVVTAEHIALLPNGCLVVLVTRTSPIDMKALRKRVLANELALAADVFDEEPLPHDDPLLGLQNVVHTPHIAGRTRDSNRAWADLLAAKFTPAAALQ